MKKIIGLILLFFAFIFMISCRGAADSLFYHPTQNEAIVTEAIQKEYNVQEMYFAYDKQQKIHVWFLPAKTDKVKGTIVHFHGNAGNMNYHISLVGWLTNYGYQVVMFDYRGFGASIGSATLDNMRQDSLFVVKEIVKNPQVQNRPLILYGQSLGGAMAVYTAAKSREKFNLVILAGTFGSFPHIAQTVVTVFPTWFVRWCVSHDEEPIDLAKEVKCPVLQIHSKSDQVVPFECGELLRNKFKTPYYFMEVPDERHVHEVLNQPWKGLFLKYLNQMLEK